jgi:hypothetical protein
MSALKRTNSTVGGGSGSSGGARKRSSGAAAGGGGAQKGPPPAIGAGGGLVVPSEVYQTLDRATVLRRDRDRLAESVTIFQQAIDLMTTAAGHPHSIGGARIMTMAAETAQEAKQFQKAAMNFEQAYLSYQISNAMPVGSPTAASEEHEAIIMQTLWQWAVCCSQEVGILNTKLGIVNNNKAVAGSNATGSPTSPTHIGNEPLTTTTTGSSGVRRRELLISQRRKGRS